MASEQFSLCWDNFHKNMSSGLNALLENEDLVDVTLAVEGKFFKAHQMVLSVCSPYFKELFKTNPCQHPIVFLKDVSYVAISDLLQFMYQGEVQVSQDNLTTFIKTAEALQIKGLTGDGNGTDADSEPTQDKPVERQVEETYKPMPRPKKAHPAPIVTTTPAVKKPRLSLSSNDQPAPAPVTKTEPTIEPSQFKVEPFDPSQSVTIPDDGDETFGDDTLDDTTVDDNEDYSMMEGEEPQAGTSTDGAGEGQDINKVIAMNSLPEKSRKKYESVYSNFMEWFTQNNQQSFSEEVLMVYFQHLAANYTCSSLWAYYSMLRSTLSLNDNIDLGSYSQLREFLKQKSKGYKSRKAKFFSQNEIDQFLYQAPDDEFLDIKVALILGITGACRTHELHSMTIEDFQDFGTAMLVTVQASDTKPSRQFTLTGYSYELCKKYMTLRPDNALSNHFFLNYLKGKCTPHNIGINKLGRMGKQIAMYLKLPEPNNYTGHCFRKSSSRWAKML